LALLGRSREQEMMVFFAEAMIDTTEILEAERDNLIEKAKHRA
jgi:hypothetical protein